MKKTPIKKVSSSQRIKNADWKKRTEKKCEELNYMCQWCETAGHRVDPESLFYLDGHHIIRRSRGGGNDISNAYLCHRMCHTEITDKNVDVLKYPTKELWEAKDD